MSHVINIRNPNCSSVTYVITIIIIWHYIYKYCSIYVCFLKHSHHNAIWGEIVSKCFQKLWSKSFIISRNISWKRFPFFLLVECKSWTNAVYCKSHSSEVGQVIGFLFILLRSVSSAFYFDNTDGLLYYFLYITTSLRSKHFTICTIHNISLEDITIVN